jgi:tight adherence protein C
VAVVGVAVVGVAVVVVGPVPVLVAIGAAAGWRWAAGRRRVAAARRVRDRAVPDLVDQFVLAASSGCPVAQALTVVAPRAPPPLRRDVGAALDRFRRGLPLGEALAGLGWALGPEGQPLTDALARAAAGGTPLGPALADVAATARDRRRRAAQEAAHRLPVTLLFPLTLCVLPAALALAVVPIVAAAVASLAP